MEFKGDPGLIQKLNEAAEFSDISIWNESRKIRNYSSLNLQGINLRGMKLFGDDPEHFHLVSTYTKEAPYCLMLYKADLRGANLTNANLMGAYLQDANLSDAKADCVIFRSANMLRAKLKRIKLSRANLRKVCLSEADLSNADLSEADLRESYLPRAKFVYANLIGADLSESYLSGVDFSGAECICSNFTGADLSGAKLYTANFKGAVLSKAKFGEIDLTRIKGLSGTTECSNADISEETLILTLKGLQSRPDRKEEIVSFLTSAGVTDYNLIPFINFEPPPKLSSVFISYSRSDSKFVLSLFTSLMEQGINCWLDEENLRAGEIIRDEINDALQHCDKVILCCSSNSLHSDWVKYEVKLTLNIEKSTGKLLLIPLNLDTSFQKWCKTQVKTITERLAVDFTNWRDPKAFSASIKKLLDALKK